VRIVLDTNVLVSAFLFPGGSPERVYRLVLSGDVTLVTSRPLLAELGQVLTQKFAWEADYAQEVVTQLARIGEVVEPLEVVDAVREDPPDNRVLEAAAAGTAEVIVSGDRHLRRLGSWQGIQILDPARFLEAASLSSDTPTPLPEISATGSTRSR
jgi:putative PIN family toxin of toxin-antitoxin system